MEKNANAIEIIEIMKLYRKGILFNFKPYETLIAKLSMFAAIPINNIDIHCILISPCNCLLSSIYMSKWEIACGPGLRNDGGAIDTGE